ncbi:hypothetical protein DFH08DRAFT_267430 [Mycena albidolilacea]|uniref:EthD domain-containing protein n=1 Tax=Mycena albidolilacea TaxID=1033008 RepID=A0AAD7ANU9_9AGAR|nr:hypothetical protein DFH08DRAFT_267430 [Mycena albidolilacea]
MSFRTDRVRVAILLKRKATLSREEFRRYWIETHGPLVNSLDVIKTNLLKIEQAHVNESVIAHLTQMPFGPSEWDGIAIFEAESYAKIFEVFQNEEYQKKIIPDNDVFLDAKGCQLLPLDVLTVVDK